VGLALLLLLAACGCRTVPPMGPIDMAAEPGWTLRHGQVVWKTERSTAGIAGDLLVATHPSGRSFVQFIKSPLPLISAQSQSNGWQVELIPQKQTVSGTGPPPVRWLWLHLPSALAGDKPVDPLQFRSIAGEGWVLENVKTGASLAGYLSP
jgi:hypothetical protein